MVECQLPKLDVAGSIPVSRSNLIKHTQPQNFQITIRRCSAFAELKIRW